MREVLDKQKLLQWVEDKLDVYSGPYDDDTPEDTVSCKGKINLLRILEMDIAAGRLDAVEERQTNANEEGQEWQQISNG